MRYQPYMLEWFKQAKDQESELGWINGLYVTRAISSVLPKGSAYPNTPLTLYGTSEENDEETYVLSDADRFAGFAIQYNKANESKFKREEIIDVDVVEETTADKE